MFIHIFILLDGSGAIIHLQIIFKLQPKDITVEIKKGETKIIVIHGSGIFLQLQMF